MPWEIIEEDVMRIGEAIDYIDHEHNKDIFFLNKDNVDTILCILKKEEKWLEEDINAFPKNMNFRPTK